MDAPSLRFIEFSEEWSTKKLSEITSAIGDGLHSTPIYDDNGNYYFTNGSNIQHGKLKFDENTKTINHEEFLKYRSKLSKNSILVSLNGATWGRFGLYNGEPILLGKSLGYINVMDNISKNFLYYLLQTKKIRRFFESVTTGSTIKNLSLHTLRNTELKIPSLKEQEKIADFYVLLNQKIQLQQERIELLKDQKKGYMQKIFNRNLRFKDTNNNYYPMWKKLKFNNFLYKSNCKKVKTDDIDVSKLITVRLHGLGVIKNTNTSTLKLGSTIYYKRNAGDFIYGKQNFFNGAFGIIPVELEGFLSSNDIPTLKFDLSVINPIFFLEYIGRESFYKNCEKLASGTGSKRIHEETLLDMELELPSLNEQNKIADFLLRINNKINYEELKIQFLISHKQALMQKMFI
ncbi:restriction endonuclease subunit S [Mesobacillus selenatarsenatis]|uniref:Type I restriction modification DNA specificity domain-containing protein n=1 Tax=Mesobacillus selenatarsenatis TaxID=388741 RepID=A0A846TQR1_9BACI|nr:restriction endonuclease subunit S [Mesobacillus selenatarsenatis]NKE07627.1 hypothetical protein [Mesobacillus selenatarsenatis]